MKYLGSKNRISKYILPIMTDIACENNINTWVEPFVGGGNMIDKVPSTFRRVGIDINPHAVAALVGIRDFVDHFPDKLTEDEYRSLKGTPPDPITSWLRFVCSFGAKFEGGYARQKGSDEYTYVGYGKRNALKQSPNLQGVELIVGDFTNHSYFENCLIYCDPPYKGTTSYKTKEFDHAAFWQWCRYMSNRNLLFVSEYQAPDDFKCVWEGELKTNFSATRTAATHSATEKLFTYGI